MQTWLFLHVTLQKQSTVGCIWAEIGSPFFQQAAGSAEHALNSLADDETNMHAENTARKNAVHCTLCS